MQFVNIFKDHHLVPCLDATAIGYDIWSLSSTRWIKFTIVKVNIALN